MDFTAARRAAAGSWCWRSSRSSQRRGRSSTTSACPRRRCRSARRAGRPKLGGTFDAPGRPRGVGSAGCTLRVQWAGFGDLPTQG